MNGNILRSDSVRRAAVIIAATMFTVHCVLLVVLHIWRTTYSKGGRFVSWMLYLSTPPLCVSLLYSTFEVFCDRPYFDYRANIGMYWRMLLGMRYVMEFLICLCVFFALVTLVQAQIEKRTAIMEIQLNNFSLNPCRRVSDRARVPIDSSHTPSIHRTSKVPADATVKRLSDTTGGDTTRQNSEQVDNTDGLVAGPPYEEQNAASEQTSLPIADQMAGTGVALTV